MYGKKTGTKHSNFDLGPALNIPKERSVKGGCPSVGVSECARVCALRSYRDVLIGLMSEKHGKHRQVQRCGFCGLHTHTRKTHKYTLIILLPQLFRRHRT